MKRFAKIGLLLMSIVLMILPVVFGLMLYLETKGGTEMVMPGDNVEMDVELISPIAIEDGTRFSIREGGRTVGSGVVTIIEA